MLGSTMREDNLKTPKSLFNHIKHANIKILIIITIMLVSVLLGLFLSKESAKKSTPRLLPPASPTAQDRIYNTANQLSLSGKPEQAQQSLDTQIKQAKDVKDEGILYEFKASVALNNSDFKTALEYAQKAESLSPTRNSASLIANSAELLGNKPLAIQYYKILITRTNPKTDDYTIPGLEQKIKSLEAGNG